MNILNPAYLAGVADADGSFSICARNRSRKTISYESMFQLSWTDSPKVREAFTMLKNKYGGSTCEAKSSSHKSFKNSRPVFRYNLTGKSLIFLINDVFPFLLLKRKQARNCILLTKSQWKPGYKNKPKRLNEFHNFLFDLNKTLNTKNGTIK